MTSNFLFKTVSSFLGWAAAAAAEAAAAAAAAANAVADAAVVDENVGPRPWHPDFCSRVLNPKDWNKGT